MPTVKYTILSGLLLLFHLNCIYSQQGSDKKMFSNDKEAVYVELAGQYATVYNLGRVYDKGLAGFSIDYIDTLVKQPGVTDTLFAGKKSQLSQSGNTYYLKLDMPGSKRDRSVKLDPSDDVQKDYLEINRAYWLDVFINLSNEINSEFPLQHYSFRGYDRVDMGNQQLLPYEQFKILADKQIKELKDSLVFKHSNFTSITNEVLNNFQSIEYSLLKERLEKLGETPEGYPYFEPIIKKICKEKPEWFYQLAEDMPSKKEAMFDLVYGSSLVKNLKAVKTDSPVKKEFLQHKHKERKFTFQAIGVSIAGAALLGFALFSLIN